MCLCVECQYLYDTHIQTDAPQLNSTWNVKHIHKVSEHLCVCVWKYIYRRSISLYDGGPLVLLRERLVVLAGPLVCIPHTQEGY